MDCPQEWRPVVGFEGLYEVSDQGRVRSLRLRTRCSDRLRNKPLALSLYSTERGYQRACLIGPNARKIVGAHRLVLEAFVGPCPAGMEGCHNDGRPENNRLSNLRWDTRYNNVVTDQKRHGTYVPCPVLPGEKNGRAILTAIDVLTIRAEPNFRGVNVALGRRYGLSPNSIGDIRARRSWRHLPDKGSVTTTVTPPIPAELVEPDPAKAP